MTVPVRTVRGRRTAPRPDRANRRPDRRAQRRKILRRRAVALLTILSLIALAYGVWFTPLFGVRSVDVRGTVVLTEDEVRTAAAIEPGSPLVRLDLKGIVTRVAAVPRVASVEVERSLPGTVRILIAERTPVGVVKASDGAHLIDSTGKDYAVLSTAPPLVPELVLSAPGQGDAATRAAVGVLNELPEKLRPEVQSVAATTGADVKVTLTQGRIVRWGSSAETPRKAAVLLVLLTRPGTTYDVSSPDLPTVS
ncbi:FtsQ-type POTRA domain-containing protein [Lentzea tibetensis]|uniref:FtsQ-type POTRA domain-containing protein n=1 Tax=Lentzea tibetensis TaxID=2591470 RepID=A0A563ER73_9PSEU|nr:FtsQ-type POTRA domain-containing protein [Lentzea tibetensis]TWP50255.1 FtsQ-type POTRA domain-containing protein [Lentzea tibetensis]